MAFYAHNNCQPDYGDNPEDPDPESTPMLLQSQSTSKNATYRVLMMLQILVTFIFTCFIIYAVVTGNTDSVRAACPHLWEFMTARILSGMGVGALILFLHYYLLSGSHQQQSWVQLSNKVGLPPFPFCFLRFFCIWTWRSKASLPFCILTFFGVSKACSPWNTMLMVLCFLFVFFCVFFVTGLRIVPGILSDAAGQVCSNTLSDTVMTGSPLLAYLGWVFLVCDGLASGVIIVLIVYIFSMTPSPTY